jgi:hypothetical protein
MIRYSCAGLVIDTSGGGGGWKRQLWLGSGRGSGHGCCRLLLAAAPAPQNPCNSLSRDRGCTI